MSRHEYSESTLSKLCFHFGSKLVGNNVLMYTAMTVAELVLTSISYLFLINSLVDLWEKHATQKHDEQIEGQFGLVNEKTVHLQKKNRWVHYAAWYVYDVASFGAVSGEADPEDFSQVPQRRIDYIPCIGYRGRCHPRQAVR